MTRRLVAAFVAVVLLALLVQDIPLAGYLRDVERERIVTALERDAFVLAGRSEEALHSTTPDADGTVSTLAQQYRVSSGARVVIVDATGLAIVTSDEDTGSVGDSFLTRPEVADALAGGVISGTRFSTTLDQELLYVAVPVLSGDEILGAVRLTYPNQIVTDAVNQKLLGFGLVGLTTVLLAALIGFVMARATSRQLRLLRDATERFADGDRSARADEASGAKELTSLAHSFNGMAGRIDLLLEEQRAFAADASHQLRTPLTALRLRLERAADLAHTDPDGAVERIEAADAELDRLENLIEGLLVLSRAEGRELASVVVNADTVARERVAQWADLAAERGLSVRYAAPADARLGVLAVPTALEQIIDNLVDNALTISPAGGVVEVRLLPVGDRLELHVLDRGPGLDATQRSRAFERFWRGGHGGSANGNSGGSGLGLAIVAQLARASGATAELRARDGGGIDAVVVFASA